MTLENTIKSLIDTAGLSYKESKISWIFDCPNCFKSAKLYIRKRDGRFVCWYCQTTERFFGKPEWALSKLLSLPVREIKNKLYGESEENNKDVYVQVEIHDFFGDTELIPEGLIPPSPVAEPLDHYSLDHPHAARGLEYVLGRGISLDVATKHQIKYKPKERRVIFPILLHGELVGWQARTIDPSSGEVDGRVWKGQKILTTLNGDRNAIVMGQDNLIGSTHAILVEGPVDMIKTHLCGGGVATMGKSISNGQLDIIKDSGVTKVYLGLDPDAAHEINRICAALPDVELYRLLPPSHREDLGEATDMEVLEAFRTAPRINNGMVFVAPLTDRFRELRRQEEALEG